MELAEGAIPRKSRKTWICYGCSKDIPPRTDYIEWKGEGTYAQVRPWESGRRYCLECGVKAFRIKGKRPDDTVANDLDRILSLHCIPDSTPAF